MINIILAGLLGLPCLAVVVVTAPVVAVLSIPSLLLLTFRKQNDDKKNDRSSMPPRHVIVVGGSSGIGLSIAKECARRNIAKISIIARNQRKLDQAKKEIETEIPASTETTTIPSSKINAISVSVTDFDALEKAAASICKEDDRTVLFNCAGIPYTTDFDNVPVEKYLSLVETNQLGAMYVARAFLSHMATGCIVFCSSAAGQVGMYGYTAYAPTKYAIRGFAETLHMELLMTKPGVSVQVAFPVDTNTPGYQEEKDMMPEITKTLNANAGLACPDGTAKQMVKCAFARNPKFQVYFNFEGWMLSNLTAGMSPVVSLGDALSQVVLSGLFRFISLFYLNDFWRIIRQHAAAATTDSATAESDKTKKEDDDDGTSNTDNKDDSKSD